MKDYKKDYVEERDGGLYIKDTRISLDSVVYAFNRGESPEGIVQSFPFLTLEQVYGAITYYLANKADVDEYIKQGERDGEKLRLKLRKQYPKIHAKLDALKQTR